MGPTLVLVFPPMKNTARLAVLLVAALLVGCSSAGGSLVPIRAVGSAVGDATGPQVFLLDQPMNALVKIHGEVKYTVQPFPPYVTLDGDYTIIVEPLPGREVEAQASIESGALLIRRAGQPSALNAPGSIRSFKASTQALRSYVPPPPAREWGPAPEPIAIAPCGDPDHPESCLVPRDH
jgi:hypothetical protein